MVKRDELVDKLAVSRRAAPTLSDQTAGTATTSAVPTSHASMHALPVLEVVLAPGHVVPSPMPVVTPLAPVLNKERRVHLAVSLMATVRADVSCSGGRQCRA